MSNLDLIAGQLKNNIAVYLKNDLEDICIRLEPTINSYNSYAKQKGKEEYKIDKKTNLVMETEMGGNMISKKQYNEY